MKKPKKTLKELSRLEKLLARQTARSAKLLARRSADEEENPVTAPIYARLAERHAAALGDHSEVVRLIEDAQRAIAQAQSEKAARKAGDAVAKKNRKPAGEVVPARRAGDKAPLRRTPRKGEAA